MCGIAGIALKKRTGFNLTEKIVLMTDALRHRGPDGQGFILSDLKFTTPHFNNGSASFSRTDLAYIPTSPLPSSTDATLAFGHRRLNIIDLSEAGHQPMSYKNDWINFNGEIYNYIELREEL